MTPVTQRFVGYPFGECVRASYASILDLPIEEVPRMDPAAFREAGFKTQLDMERAWLDSVGFDLIGIQAGPYGPVPLGQGDGNVKRNLSREVLGAVEPAYHLLSGLSPRGFGHRCVGFGGKLAWDPHPSRAGLLSFHSIGFLTPR